MSRDPSNCRLENYKQLDDLRGKKLDVWEGGIHVPASINWPGKAKARELDEAVHIIDWFPTLAGIIGFQTDKSIDWDGVDISPLLLDQKALPECDLSWIWNSRINRWALRHQHWKIVRYSRRQPAAKDLQETR